ncbi:PaaX family transcriptional regulator C-terminal domain-containing protein [Amycolatopsis taiwanensis]|uniref:PaaX family transcriptional regulator n=1 Tax=Amycolatopsis taiwanensis TaxID=342230 RepID=A0A9W6R632_9PSEU|nr:PaaX family transcriptional regulator C-terminal domain-containing protein [Amycolatopsis taiwanensis]GLY70114.1 hypothetical protein Atai01_67330 [Amycolatopsis taiwanensis]
MNSSATYPELETGERGRSIGLVPFLFGLAGTQSVPAKVINHLLVDLGMSAAAAKAQLARMRQRGQLTATRHGRTVDYQLAGPFGESFHRIRSGMGASPPEWRGSFHALLYQVPESARAFRDHFRRNALLVGYGLLQQGVLIAPADRTESLAAILARRPSAATIYPATLHLALPDARSAAAAAWALPEIEQRYLRHCHDLREALARSARPEPGAAALRRFAELVNGPMIDTLLAPSLPTELLPKDWPGRQLFELIGEVNGRYGPATSRYVRDLIEQARS